MKILSYLWQLPQNIVGLIVLLLSGARQNGNHYEYNWNGSVSLGNYIFISHQHKDSLSTLQHEQGHQIQSMYLGWLYLVVIGIPSFIWAGCFEKYRKKHGISYYDFYTEKWANMLGGVHKK